MSAAGGAFAGILIANNIARLNAGIAAAPNAWKPLEARGLTVGEEGGRPVLTGAVQGVAVTVKIVSDVVKYAHTEVSAKPPEGVDATVGVHPSPGGVLGQIRSWIGQDIVVGDADFDRAFLVTAKPAGAAKVLLDEAKREHLVALAGTRLAGFTYGRERVAVLLHGVETDPEVLAVAIDLVVDAAGWTL
jgi:hypothetical protein